MRRILLLAALLSFAGPALAQDIYYVDPVTGDDLANSGAAGSPFKTVTHALTVAGSGDTIELKDGDYVAGAVNVGETYPLILEDGVTLVYPGSDHAASFNAGGATSAFRLNTTTTAGGALRGVNVTNCTIGVEVTSSGGATGVPFDIDSCTFDAFSVAGVRALTSNGATNVLWVRDCAFTPVLAPHGVRIEVSGSGTGLALSVVRDNTVTNCAVGVALEASDGGSISSTTEVRGNNITDAGTANLHLLAEASAARGATNSAEVHSNLLESGAIGLWVEVSSTQGPLAACDSAVAYNQISGNAVNVRLETNNNGFSDADLTCAFTGNLVINAVNDGMVCAVLLPKTGGVNCKPDLGTASANTGRNTFKSNSDNNLVLDADMANYLTALAPLAAEGNFWGAVDVFTARQTIDFAGIPETTVDLDPVFVEILSATLSPRRVTENTATTVVVRAAANSGFVDNDDPAATVAQMIAAITRGATTLQVDPAVFADGSGFSFDTPEISEQGVWRLDVVLPGGQVGSFTFEVTEVGSGGGGGTGCFVATAAHGDEDAREVRVLRRFRDDYLLASEPGRAFVRGYYEHGPAAADWIAERPWARSTARAALAAPTALAELLLGWSAAERLAAAVLLLGAGLWLFRRR